MNPNPSFRFYALLIIAMITWGFAWPSGKAVAGMADQSVIIFWRFLATAISLIPVVLIMGKSFSLPGKRVIFEVTLGGVLYTIYNQFFLMGLETGLAGSGGVLVTTLNPIFTYLIVNILAKKFFSKREVLGLVLGFFGGMVILQVWKISWDHLLVSGNLFFLLASFTWALLSMNSHKTGEKISPVVYGFYVYAIGTVFDLAFAWDKGILSVWSLGWNFWFQIFYLAIVSTTFGTTVYFFASTRLGSRTASSFIFLVPVTALFGSWIFLGEIPMISTLVGGGFAMAAVYILNQKNS
ncbi:MAG: DMT family transporter [Leptospira sp.]|nr:DMT family transporter [Leptospira sp.]